MRRKIDIVLTPELLPAHRQEGSVAVVIDVLRASATIITALNNGAEAIFPLETTEEAERFARKGMLVGAERNVVRCDFARFGNDPFEYTPDAVNEQPIYFTTTNGTRTIKACMQEDYETIIGTFLNISAVVDYCRNNDVICVCAGWRGRPCKEDTLFAAAICAELRETHDVQTDLGEMLVELWEKHQGEISDYIMESDHYSRMLRTGKDNSYGYCITRDLVDIVPVASVDEEGMIKLAVK